MHDHAGHSDHHGHFGHSHGGLTSTTRLVYALILTLSFMVVEIVGGWWTNSLALMTDAAHMMSDAGGLFLSLVVMWIAKRPASNRKTFGYQRAEVLGAWLNGMFVVCLSGFLLYQSSRRLMEPQVVNGEGLTWVALAGLLVNTVSLWFLHGGRDSNLNLRGAYIHVLGDLLGSLAALASGLLVSWTGRYEVDPLASIAIACIVLWSASRLIYDATRVLMEFAPKHVNPDKIREELANLPQVEGVHDLHIWSVASGSPALSVHLLSRHPETVLAQANSLLKGTHQIRHTTIQIEHPDRFSKEDCFDCEGEGQ